MATLAKVGWGAEFHLAHGTTGVLTEIAEVTGIQPPSSVVDHVDVTHFKSPAAYREYIAGLIETGEADFVMNYAPGSPTDILCRTAAAARKVIEYKIVLPAAGGKWNITGSLLPKQYNKDIPIDDKMMATLSVKFSGPETEAAGV